MQIKVTTATKKLLKLRKKIRAISGGTGASKTYSIVMILIDYAQVAKNEHIDIVSESYPHLEAGVMQDFKSVMIGRNYWNDDLWNSSKHIYTFETGTTIKFTSIDKLGKAHGPRRDVLFLNECNYIPYQIADQLIARTRKIVWLDWNPSEDFWFYEEILGKRTDIDFLGEGGNYPPLTYLNNQGLTPEERAEIEARKGNENWWRVYGLGLRGVVEGRIYTNWKIIDDIPHEARLERYGLDFGYDPDPAAIVAVYYFNGGYTLDEVLYGKRIDNPQLASTLKNLPQALVIADSAEPKSIDEIRRLGINIVGAEKGADSVRHGVKTLQAQRISVTSRSLNLIREYRNFFQAVDKRTNNALMGVYDGERHILDATRYAICSMIPIRQRKEKLAQMFQTPPVPRINPV
jgi:phage terminase large subunit